MKNTSEFERKHPVLANLILPIVVSAGEIWIWLIGAFLVFVIGGVTLSQLSDGEAYILPILIGLIVLFGILLPIFMVAFSWRNKPDRDADSRSRATFDKMV